MARRSKKMAQKRRRNKANKKKHNKNASHGSIFPKKQSKVETSLEVVEFFATIFRPIGSIFRWFDW